MFRQPIRTLTLALALIALAGTYLHAASTSDTSGTPPSTVSNDGPTGGDPDPPGPSAVSIALMLLQLGIE
jgi:hypothetical protein